MRSFRTTAALATLKTLLIIFNIIFLLSGIVLFVLGIWLQVELHKYLEISADFTSSAPYLLIGTGVFIIFLSIVACCCTLKEQPILLYIYSAFLVIVFVVEICAFISAFAYRGPLKESFHQGLSKSLQVYNKDHQRTSSVNTLQHTLNCCGVEDYKDWFQTPFGKVPGSCCMTNMGCDTTVIDNIYTKGCFLKVTDFLTEKFTIVCGSALAFSCFQLLGVLITAGLASLLQKSKYEEISNN